MVAVERFDKRITDIRNLEDKIAPLKKLKFSILDEIGFRFAISSVSWYNGMIKPLNKKQMEKLPKPLQKVLNLYYLLSGEINDFYVAIREASTNAIRSFLGIRKRLIEVMKNIRRGLLEPAIADMDSIISVLKSSLDQQGDYPKGGFEKFWAFYVHGNEFFSNVFLPSFPSSYDPRVEPDFNVALERAFGLEQSFIDLALSGQVNDALKICSEWQNLMIGFVRKRELEGVMPKRII